MKHKITLWLLAFLSCAALGLWQKDNLSTFCREYNALQRSNEKRPLIPENIARNDPEAATIAESILVYHQQDERLLNVAEGLVQYPQNEFFLGQFAAFISDSSAYDPNLRLMVAKRLISLNPQKPFYHYFMADALLACDNDINIVLNAVEQGNRCCDYNIPYDKYKQRVIDIAEKAEISRMNIRDIDRERWNPSPFHLDRNLISFAAASFADGDNLLGTRICDAVYGMQRKHALSGEFRGIHRNMNISPMIHFGRWDNPEGLELQRVELSEDRARENRFRLCARISENILAKSENAYPRPQDEEKDEYEDNSAIIAIILAPHFGRMFVSFGLAVLILALFCLADGYPKNEKVGLVKTSMFVFACLVFSLVAKGVFVQLARDSCCSSYQEILSPPKFDLDILWRDSFLTVIFLIVPLTGLLLLQISRKSRWWIRLLFLFFVTVGCIGFIVSMEHIDNCQLFLKDLILPIIVVSIIFFTEIVLAIIARWLSKWKIVWLAVAASLFGSLSIAAQGYSLEFLVMLLFILFSASTIFGPSPKDKSPVVSLFNLFAADTQQAIIRIKCLKLVAPFIILYWLLFVAMMPASAYRINYEVNRDNPPIRKYKLLEPSEATYHRVLNYLENKQRTRVGIFGLLGLVMPEDLPAVLEKFKEIPIDVHYVPPSPPHEPNRAVDPNIVNDALLTRAMTSSGRDAVNIISAAITVPDNQQTLLARAKLGDVTAKQPLETLLAKRIAEGNDFPASEINAKWWQRPVKSYEIISALACISGPNEAARRYISYIQRNGIFDLFEDFDFLRSVNLLPSPQVRSVIKACLTKTKGQDLSQLHLWPRTPDLPLYPFHSLLGIYGDKEIAEEAFELMLQSADQNSENTLFDISPYLTIESAELLKKGLSSDNDKFRAWSVWQLRKVGYQFSQDEIEKLMRDESWMVRANTVIVAPEMTKNLAQNDKNPFVKFTASLQN